MKLRTLIPNLEDRNEHRHDPDHHHPRPACDLPVPARLLEGRAGGPKLRVRPSADFIDPRNRSFAIKLLGI
jgi:hypothetical protein